jgi:hypothetical protein
MDFDEGNIHEGGLDDAREELNDVKIINLIMDTDGTPIVCEHGTTFLA